MKIGQCVIAINGQIRRQRHWVCWMGIVMLGLINFSSKPCQSAVWTDVNTWDAAWEVKYSQWVESKFNSDFFVYGDYGEIRTDCSDAVYYSRLIFTYENKLPYAIRDPSGGSRLITNRIGKFDRLAEPNRIMAFINYIGKITGTRTLIRDTYSVDISREWIKPGIVWFQRNIFEGKQLYKHTETVISISETGAVQLIGSTEPPMARSMLTSSSLTYLPDPTLETGFRKWILPQNFHLPVYEQPGYSRSQYDKGHNEVEGKRDIYNWLKEVSSILRTRKETKAEVLLRFANDLNAMVDKRAGMVNEAMSLRNEVQRCLTASEYNNYSTPSRDKRIYDTLLIMMQFFVEESANKKDPFEKLEVAFSHSPSIYLSPQFMITFMDYMKIVYQKKNSSNPNDSLEARWGQDRSRTNCPVYD